MRQDAIPVERRVTVYLKGEPVVTLGLDASRTVECGDLTIVVHCDAAAAPRSHGITATPPDAASVFDSIRHDVKKELEPAAKALREYRERYAIPTDAAAPVRLRDADIIGIRRTTKALDASTPWGETLAFARAIETLSLRLNGAQIDEGEAGCS
jgi:hypothetical protein